MLVRDGDAPFDDRIVRDLPDILRPGDVLVFNDTRVIPAQLEGLRGEARIGATLHKREGLAPLAGVRSQWQAAEARAMSSISPQASKRGRRRAP